MANGPDNRLDDDDFGGAPPPSESPADLSQFDDDQALAGVPIGGDAEALKGIRRRTSTFGRIVGVLLIVAAIGFGWAGYRMTIGKDQRMQAVEACGQQEGEAMLSCLRDEFGKSDYTDVRARIIRNLAHFNDPQAVPLYIEALDERGEVRREAALALAALGSPAADPARQKLLDVLPDTDELDRAQVVWALAILRESNAADAILEQFIAGRLQEMPGWDPKVITDVLGPARLASDELLGHEQEGVRLLTALALAESGSAEAIDPLSRLVSLELARPEDRRSLEVIRAAATGLGRTGDARAAQPLFELLRGQPDMADGIVASIGRSVSAAGLSTLVAQATDAGTKRELVRLLAATHDPAAADTLATLLESDEAEVKSTAANALAELGDERALDTLLVLAAGEDDGISDAALQGLKRLASPRAADGLLAMLPDHCPPEPEPEMPAGCYRQAAVLRALGATGDERGARRIEVALDGVDSPAAAQALGAMHYEGAFAHLLEMVERPADIDMTATEAGQRSLTNEDLLRTRKGAILAMGWYGNPEAAEGLMKVVEDPMDDYELRALASQSIGRIATPELLQQVIGKIQDANVAEDARSYYVQALWQKPQPELNAALMALIGSADAPDRVRRAAAVAVGYSALPANDEQLIAYLGAEASRRDAAFAIALGGGADAAHALVTALGEDAGAQEILQYEIMAEENDWFNVITAGMLESGAVWRRIDASAILAEGDRRGRYGYAWLKTVEVLRSGWEGPEGATPQQIRMTLYAALTGEDAAKRRTSANILGALNERGLLLKARDTNGPGATEARAEILSQDTEE